LRYLRSHVFATFAAVVEYTKQYAAVGVDIPIGLSDDDRRLPDIEARTVLRPRRHNSVFPAPLRPVLGIRDYREACAISARAHKYSKRLSKQTHALLPKIEEVDDLMDEDTQRRVFEVHPEVCFWAMNGCEAMAEKKTRPVGEAGRARLLSREFRTDVLSTFQDFRSELAQNERRGVALNDFLDACAAAWTAARFARGEAKTLPENPPLDSRGLRMQIVY